MNVINNENSEWKTSSLKKKPSVRRDGSYRIIHITRKQEEDSEDDEVDHYSATKINQINETKVKPKKKSFKHFTRDGSSKFKRKSTKSSRILTNDLSSSVITNDAATNQSSKTNKHIQFIDSSDSDALGEEIDNTLNDLLARASQLETTVIKKPEFNKVQRLSRTSIQRRRKSFFIATSAFVIVLILLAIIVLFAVAIIWRQKILANSLLKSTSIHGF